MFARPSLGSNLTKMKTKFLSLVERNDISTSRKVPKILPIALKTSTDQSLGASAERCTHIGIFSSLFLWVSKRGVHYLKKIGAFPKHQFHSSTESIAFPFKNLTINHPLVKIITLVCVVKPSFHSFFIYFMI